MGDGSSSARALRETAERNVFVMMRYRDDAVFEKLERSVRDALDHFGLVARLAKDAALHPAVWENVVTYMEASRYGLAVFEEIDERDFNPNVSMELGYMYALRRPVLLLKDRRMRALQTDLCGHIYRDFDSYDMHRSVVEQVTKWCESDLMLTPRDRERIVQTPLDRAVESHSDRSRFEHRASWPDHVLCVLEDYLGGYETSYIVWNERDRKLWRFYRDGVRWDGPMPLSAMDEARVSEHLGLSPGR